MAGSVCIVNAGSVVVNKNQKRMPYGGRPWQQQKALKMSALVIG
ncbi:MAG: hypothetical protein QM300_14710 [Pseudomonadota bacterium]|nr:hypothetical protein [Pseudomonadota bacterium]